MFSRGEINNKQGPPRRAAPVRGPFRRRLVTGQERKPERDGELEKEGEGEPNGP